MHGITRMTLALAAAGLVALPAAANDIAELKARVADLENQVRQLDKNIGNVPKTFNTISAGEEEGTFKLPGSITSVGLYGFVHLDAYKDTQGRTADWAQEPGTIAIRNDATALNDDVRKGKFNMTVRTSRFGIKSFSPTDMGVLKTKLEFDFYEYGDDNYNMGYTNSFKPRLRHAYGEIAGDWGTLMVGQTWSTFMNVDVIPETVDFNGPGTTVFVRQPMIRYSLPAFAEGKGGVLSVALENPATMMGGGKPQAAGSNSIDKRPDVIVDYTLAGDFGQVSLKGLSAEFGYDDNAGVTAKKTATAVGVHGLVKLTDKDSIMGSYVTGKGISRYVPAANYNAEYYDAATGTVQLTKTTGFDIGYARAWNDAWRSTLAFGSAKMDDSATQGGTVAANKKITQAFFNTVWAFTQRTEFGFEYATGKRELQGPLGTSDASGNFRRVQFSAHYNF